jgi:hypothetical protein
MSLTVWTEDALVKIFPDLRPTAQSDRRIIIEAARGEIEAGQAVVLCEDQHTLAAWADAGPLRHDQSDFEITPQAQWVGYVPVRESTPGSPAGELARPAPGFFPDPLIEDTVIAIRRGETQPLWLSVDVPVDAPPGLYSGVVTVCTPEEAVELPVELHVFAATVPEQRTLKVTNWTFWRKIAQYHGLEPWSEPHWDLLRAYARDLAAHRQNMLLTPIFDLIDFSAQGEEIAFDFTRLDRFIRLFIEEGVIGYIEGEHLGGRTDGSWFSPTFSVTTRIIEDGQVRPDWVLSGSTEAEEFHSRFLPALLAHLNEHGWLERYYQHLADEPLAENAESYKKLASAVRRYAPGMKIIEANHYHDLPSLDVWVPQLNFFHESYPFYQERQRAGDEVWFYTCLAPTGSYANRFIDYPLLKVRLLHWLNFHYGATGYLHWGYNHWSSFDPYLDVEPVHSPERSLPPGDHCIVYPGRCGPVDSIRFEAMRDGIEDYELLTLLAQKDPALAREISGAIIRDFDQYELDPAVFRRARRRLLESLG